VKRVIATNSVEYLQFNNLSVLMGIKHAFSTRIGGVSDSVFSTMNFGFNRGDSRENVLENQRRFCEALHILPGDLVFASQTHSTVIRRVGKENLGEGIERPLLMTGYDGLATDEPGVFLATLYADCVPLFFADPVRRVVAVSHAGWRGTMSDMAGETVRFLASEFGCLPENLFLGIGPSIGRCCFEVGEDVAVQFRKLPEEIIKSAVLTHRSGFNFENRQIKSHIDLQLINKRFALKAGIKDINIENADICTSCNSDWLFSHRASKGMRGSLCAVIGLEDKV